MDLVLASPADSDGEKVGIHQSRQMRTGLRGVLRNLEHCWPLHKVRTIQGASSSPALDVPLALSKTDGVKPVTQHKQHHFN